MCTIVLCSCAGADPAEPVWQPHHRAASADRTAHGGRAGGRVGGCVVPVMHRGEGCPALPSLNMSSASSQHCPDQPCWPHLPPPCLPQALIDLDAGSNQLTALPESLGSLKQLRYLNAMSNRLAALPEGIGGCTALLRLGLKGNRLVGLPASVGQLASLVELYLTGGRWTLDWWGWWGCGHCTREREMVNRAAAAALLLWAALVVQSICSSEVCCAAACLLPADNLLESLPAEMGGMRALVKLQVRRRRCVPAAAIVLCGWLAV